MLAERLWPKRTIAHEICYKCDDIYEIETYLRPDGTFDVVIERKRGPNAWRVEDMVRQVVCFPSVLIDTLIAMRHELEWELAREEQT